MRKLLGIVMVFAMELLLLWLIVFAWQFGPVAVTLMIIFDIIVNVLTILAYREYRRTDEGTDMV
jgi:uncharacterized membrane protein